MRNRHKQISQTGICVFLLLACSICLSGQAVPVRQNSPAGATQNSFGHNSQLALPAAEPVLLASVGDANLPDAPSATPDPASSAVPSRHHDAVQGASPAASGSLLGGYDRDVADRRYWTVTGSMFAMSVANAEIAQRCLNQRSCSWVPDSLRSRKAMYGIGIPADLAISYFTYRLKRKHSQFWFVPAALVTGINGYVAIHDYRRLK